MYRPIACIAYASLPPARIEYLDYTTSRTRPALREYEKANNLSTHSTFINENGYVCYFDIISQTVTTHCSIRSKAFKKYLELAKFEKAY